MCECQPAPLHTTPLSLACAGSHKRAAWQCVAAVGCAVACRMERVAACLKIFHIDT